ncbi:MAG: YceD family protein [Verrucomicrobiota bacterium]|jgi:uncharacterized protein
MLSVNLHHLEAHELHLQDELPVKELDLDVHDPMIRAEQPLRYDITVQKLDDGILVTGSLRLTLECNCVRCLEAFRHELNLADWTCHLPFAGEERVPVDNDCVDLTPYLREDILLEFPQHPLCKPDCRGLEKTSTGKAKPGRIPRGEMALSPWAELNKLKL